MILDASLLDYFEKLPSLRHAHDVIRASRNPNYFEPGDQLAQTWAQTLFIGSGAEMLAGTNLSALDRLFEEAPTVKEADNLKTEIQLLTEPIYARIFLDHPRKKPIMNLQEAVKIHVAFLTIEGCKQLNQFTLADLLVNTWLRLWQLKMEEQNTQQVEHREASLTPNGYRPLWALSFDQAVKEYLTRFGETSALSIAVLGAVPFSPLLTLKVLMVISKMLNILSPLFRLAQDTHFDPDECLNTGIFAVAAEQRTNIREARELILCGNYPLERLNDSLKQYWQFYFQKTVKAIESLLGNSYENSVLNQFSSALLDVAEALAQNWKSS